MVTENDLVGWYHQLNGHEFDQTPGDSEGQGSLACCSAGDHTESDMTERLNNNSMLLKSKSMNKGNSPVDFATEDC